jgi:hypothetical protein
MTQASNLAKGGSNFNADGDLSLTTGVTGTLPVANGGTGSTTTTGAANAILPSQTSNSGKYLTTNGTDTSWGTVTSNPGTVTSVSGTAPVSVATGTSTPVISMAAATASVNGYMTSTFASKLDGIAAGATNVTNNNQITNGAGYLTSVSSANLPAGTILQVVNTNFNSLVTVNSGVATVSGFSASITPASSSNKILVMVSVAIGFSGDTYPYILLQRNGTSIFTGNSASGSQYNVFLGGYGTATPGVAYRISQQAKCVLDSPATTSAVTYQIAADCPFGAPGYINRQGNQSNNPYIQYPTSTITLMEVKG